MSRIYTIKTPSGSISELPSVTTVLDIISKGDFLLNWAASQAVIWLSENLDSGLPLSELLENARSKWTEVRNDAASIGSEIHHLCELFAKYGLEVGTVNMRKEVKNGYESFLKWQKEYVVRFHKSEFQVHSHKYAFAGTLDAIVSFGSDPRKYILDFKSTNALYDSFPLQLSAYREAAREMGFPTDGEMVLRLDKNKAEVFEVKDYSKNHEKHLNAFLKLLDFWYAQKSRRLVGNKRAMEAKEELALRVAA